MKRDETVTRNMRHETDLSSTEPKKELFERFWTSFFAVRSEFARFKPRKHEAVSNSGTRRDDETKIYSASLGGFLGGHGNHADPLSITVVVLL